MKYLSNYEPYSPEEVGMSRKIIIGKHSGRHTIQEILASKGMEVDEKAAGDLLEIVRSTSIGLKRSLSENELIYIYQDYKAGMFDKL
jgi:homocitrate synthase NifV